MSGATILMDLTKGSTDVNYHIETVDNGNVNALYTSFLHGNELVPSSSQSSSFIGC